jgi:hypothetical protein
MQKRRRPSARFKARGEDPRSASENAGKHAGEQDAAELAVMDAAGAWHEHVSNGGPDTPDRREAFVIAYEAAYEKAFASPVQQLAEQVPNGV